jgi:hypothetical protein
MASVASPLHGFPPRIVPHLGRVKVARLLQDDVQALVEKLRADGRSGTYIRNALMPLRAVCRYHRLPVNPTAALE